MKIIKVRTREKLPDFNASGVHVLNLISPFEAELEMDTSVMELKDFISNVNTQSIIADISIQEVPIEDVVKQIYRGDNME